MRVFILFMLLLVGALHFNSYGQNVWSASSFKFSTDIASLEDMTGASLVSFPGAAPRATDLISFPDGFKFRLGLTDYSQFSLSTYGWLRLGAIITSSFYTSQDNVLVPFSNQATAFSGMYKLTGTAPNRKFVVEWSGIFSGGNQPVKFQAWMYERTGKIEYVQQSLNAFISGGAYSILCKAKVMGFNAQAAVDVQTSPTPSTVNYTSILTYMKAIPANTRYRFEPDTLKPVTPSIEFTNVLPGCYTVNIKDQSVTESFFNLEKKSSANTFLPFQKPFSTSTLTTGTLYAYNEIKAQPDSDYIYRAFASNGFINSDTVQNTLHTPMPLINGIKSIPGDYATINALLLDAECKHIGANLVIELQSNYSFAAEGGAVRFKPLHANKFIQSITIRPTASATALVLSNSALNPMFLIDSVQNVHIDGRAGGIGTSNNLSITQTNINLPAIAYINKAHGAGLHYLNLNGINQTLGFGMVYFGSQDPYFVNNYFNVPVHNTVINNCKFGPTSGLNYRAIVIEGGDNSIIRENEFFRNLNEAVYYNNGGTNSRIVKNRIYQPDILPSSGLNGNGVITLADMGNNMVLDSNKIGGSASTWGIGSWRQDLNRDFSIINITRSIASVPGENVYIRNNEFGNMNITGSYPFYQIYAKGNSVINNNRIGTTDSVNSIVSAYYQVVLYPYQGNSTEVKDNFISGIKTNHDGYLLNVYTIDSAVILHNDIGGSDNYTANTFTSRASGIELLGVKYALIRGNQVRGITSTTHSALGILSEWNAYTNVEKYAVVDSNRVHHLDGRRTLMGIFMRLNTVKSSSISNNMVYALRGRGPSTFTGADNPTTMFGIDMTANEFTTNVPSRDTGYVNVTNNRIFGLDYFTPSYSYLYPMTGIRSDGLNFHISNNMISLGTNTKGAASDSLELTCRGIDIYPSKKAFVEHNSIYIGGKTKNTDYGIRVQPLTYSNGKKDHYISNNIIQIDRLKVGTTGDFKYYMSAINSSNNAVVANKNIWYSTNDPNISTKLATWRTNCKCDSLTFIGDPKFINPAGDSISINLHLQPGNAADSAGTPSVIPVLNDIDNDLRINHSPVDIGADAVTPCAVTGNTGISISPSQPIIEICPGGTLTLTATLSGNVTGLQWQKNMNDIAGANALSYTVTTPGSYRLVGKNACGGIASSSVFVLQQISNPFVKLLTLSSAPYCDSSAVEMQIDHNHFSLTTLQYKWYRNFVLIPGKTTDRETIEAIRDGDRISVEAINNSGCGTTTVSDYTYLYTIPSTRPKISILSYQNTLYSIINTDTVKYRISNPGNGIPEVLYTTTVPGGLHQFVTDSMLIFTNIPYSIKFRLIMGSTEYCYYADTSSEMTIFVSNTATPKTYTFNGTGNWNNPSNWLNNEMPPSPLPFNGTILISPSAGSCILNVPFTVGIGGQLTVTSGASFIIMGNLTVQP